MISVSEAAELIQRNSPPWREGLSSLDTSQADFTADALIADHCSPPFDRVTMDGICIASDAYDQGLRQFKIAGVCAAGSPQVRLEDPTQCLEIMTGAPLPLGSQIVIPYEHLKIESGWASITVDRSRSKFENVHLRASDCQKGDTVLKKGQRLNGPHWGIAASFGYGKVRTLQPPTVMVISTGDEIVEVEARPLPHQIRRSNAHALRASLLQNGYREVALDHLPDDQNTLRSHYIENRSRFDVLIYSGGVSKGKFDYLPRMWGDMGVRRHFHEVSQRPGKPLWFGSDEQTKTMIIGLPGNPVSSLVCLHRYFLPRSRHVFARLASEVVFDKKLTYFVPVQLQSKEDGVLLAYPFQVKNSGEFTGLAGSDGFVELPADQSIFKEGESFEFFPWTAP